MYTFLSYFDLKSNFDNANHMKKVRKKRFLNQFRLNFFWLILAVEILRFSNAGKFCISKNIVLFEIVFGRELCFLFSHFFIFYAILEFQQAPYQLPKLKFSVTCIIFSSLILASFGSFSCLNASYAKKYLSRYISMQ